ncbi:MAG: PAS domain-containing protein [Methanomicrobiales archaeon]|nr:PAS domain-containing protein [Methanomicrobiales archaeon]
MELSRKLNTNRNSVAKYLEMLLVSGQVEVETFGTAKVFVLSQRLPISTLLDLTTDLIVVLDSNLKIVQTNDNFLTFFGKERKDLTGTPLLGHDLPPVSLLPLESILWEVSQKGELVKELSFLKGGREFFFRIKFVPSVFDHGGKGITLLMEDVTLQKSYERNLQVSEARYRAVVEDQTELICRRRADGSITFVNDAFCRYFHKKGEDLVGRKFDPALPGDEREEILSRSTPTRENPVAAYEQQVLVSPDSVRALLWTEHALFDTRGAISEYQAVGRDITERKETERELRIRDIAFASSINGMAIVTPDGMFSYVNQAFLDLLQIAGDQVIGKSFRELLADYDITPDIKTLLGEMQSNGSWFGEVRFKKSGGPLTHLLVSLTRVYEETGNFLCVFVSLIDITGQKLLEEAFKNTFEKLQDTIEFFPDPTFIVDRSRKVVAWNRAMESLTGVGKNDVMGKTAYQNAFSFFDMVRPVLVDLIDLPARDLARKYPNVRRFGNNLFVEAFIPAMNKGKGAYLWGKATVLTDKENNPIGAIEMVRDTTEWKKVAEVRREK